MIYGSRFLAFFKNTFFLFFLLTLIGVLFFFSTNIYASDGTEFEEAATTLEEHIRGNLGKLIALTALLMGTLMAAIRKDWTWFLGSIVIALASGIMITVIERSFTATI